jgi:hypothetical protein
LIVTQGAEKNIAGETLGALIVLAKTSNNCKMIHIVGIAVIKSL